MSKYAMLVDTNWCTGCHSCETACQVEHNLPLGQYGIQLEHVGVWHISGDKWQDTWIPVPPDQCDTCARRRAKGGIPTCVKHCQAQCMEFGETRELVEKAGNKRGVVLFVL